MIQIQKFINNIIKQLEKMGKRQRIIISTVILLFAVLFSSFLNFTLELYYLAFLILVSFLVSFMAIPTGLNKVERVMLFLLPIYFTVAFNLFFFFFPTRWLTRIPFLLIYTVSIYAILLATNILNVGSQKTLQLIRAAFSINYLFLTLSSLLMLNIFLSFKLNFFVNFLLFFIVIFPLSLQFLWSVSPKTTIEPVLFRYALFISFIIAQIGMVLSFLPVRSTVFSLILTATFYSINGLFYSFLEERLFKERIREFVFVLIFVIFIMVMSLRWG